MRTCYFSSQQYPSPTEILRRQILCRHRLFIIPMFLLLGSCWDLWSPGQSWFTQPSNLLKDAGILCSHSHTFPLEDARIAIPFKIVLRIFFLTEGICKFDDYIFYYLQVTPKVCDICDLSFCWVVYWSCLNCQLVCSGEAVGQWAEPACYPALKLNLALFFPAWSDSHRNYLKESASGHLHIFLLPPWWILLGVLHTMVVLFKCCFAEALGACASQILRHSLGSRQYNRDLS